ncbi:MAG: hypothetical protein JXR13_00010 [Thalassovita sp.]
MAGLMKSLERSMGLTAQAWDRHANPWSVYSRYSVLPLFILAVWSRDWIGAWSLVPALLCVVWARYNPHVFPPPKSTKSWASRAVLGERVWLNRKEISIPPHHATWALGLAILSGLGLPPLAWGLWDLSIGWTLVGTALVISGKTWFLDRMVLLYDEVGPTQPLYASWLR